MKQWCREALVEIKAEDDKRRKQPGYYGWTEYMVEQWFCHSRFVSRNSGLFVKACKDVGLVRLRYCRD